MLSIVCCTIFFASFIYQLLLLSIKRKKSFCIITGSELTLATHNYMLHYRALDIFIEHRKQINIPIDKRCCCCVVKEERRTAYIKIIQKLNNFICNFLSRHHNLDYCEHVFESSHKFLF